MLDLKHHYAYGMVLTSFIILGQAKHIVLELWFDWMGPDVAFRYWLLGFVVENLGKVLILYLIRRLILLCI